MQDGAIPEEEERLLARVRESLAGRAPRPGARPKQYDEELVALRDEIGEARLEDVAALIAQMERLQGVSLQRAEARAVLVDPAAPYFGHLRLREGGRERDVLIGRATFVDPERRVQIVDWRHAPLSQLYYRYEEGSDYEERFGERDVEGEIVARRTVTIEGGRLRRIACPQGVWQREGLGWRREDVKESALAGGQGSATRPRGVLGAGASAGQRLDRHLPEIAALIDPRQFELIARPASGVVVIQGGAGSGKTTIGLHRIAYLSYAAPSRFPARKMLVVTHGSALAAYIGQVLPALGVPGVRALTFRDWAERELLRAFPWLRARLADDGPAAVARVKDHPALLAELERRARAHRGKRSSRAVVELWADLLTDRGRLLALLAPELGEATVTDAHRIITERVAALVDADPAEARDDRDDRDEEADDEEVRGDTGVDGLRTEGEGAVLDVEDAALLLRAHQLVRGIRRPLAHLFVDEAQDLSPAKLAALIGQTGPQPSVTLAGDTAQRLFLDNGFSDWRHVLEQLSLAHVAVEPLRLSYRSTREILALARQVMGGLADAEPPQAPRSGAPVEAHRFPGAGAAVAFVADALRALFAREPRATVAVLARHPEQADRYHEGLRRVEVPMLRRVRAQDFAFRPGVEVTDVRQVKGLEFDYVLVVDVNDATFGRDDESRHLLHIAATRAAHQLWLIVTATPSPLLPPELLAT